MPSLEDIGQHVYMLENGTATQKLRREIDRFMTELEKLKVSECANVQQITVLWAVICGLMHIANVPSGVSHVQLQLHIVQVARQKRILLDRRTQEATMEQIFDIAENKIKIIASAPKRSAFHKRHPA